MAVNSKIKLLICTPNRLFADGLLSILKTQGFLQTTVASCVNNVQGDLRESSYDVLIMDIAIEKERNFPITTSILQTFPKLNVLTITSREYDLNVFEMLEAGVKGCLYATATEIDFTKAILTVYNDEIYCCHTTTNKILKQVVNCRFNPAKPYNRINLTQKEVTIIKYICQQMCSKEIAAKMNTNCSSIESARERIQEKIGAKNMIGVALYAVRNSIVQLP